MAECIEEGTLRAYADGALTPEQEAVVSIHLAHCDTCKGNLAEVDMLTSEVSVLVNDGAPLPDAGIALARLRGTLTETVGHNLAAASTVAVTTVSAAPRVHVYSRPMPLHPVAIGVGLASVMVAVLLSFFVMSGQKQAAFQPAKEFVPKGMVRHFKVSHTFTSTVQSTLQGQHPGTFIEEVWVTNGKNHLLRYSKSPSTNGTSWTGGETWVEDVAVYSYNPTPNGEITVFKYPYDARHLELYMPNEISYLLTIPNARIAGDDVLDGRPVTVIEAIADKVNPTPEVFAGGILAVTDYKLWVDKETSQVLQREHKSTFLDGSNKGKTQTQTFKVIANELRDASQVPPDLFKFKVPAGARVIEAPSPFGATPTPVVIQSGWHEFTSTQGSFTVLMPHTPEEQGYSSGMHMIGAREPSVTYIVTYIDHPEDTAPGSNSEKWLDDANYRALLEVDGKVLGEKPISLGQYPGREIMLQRPDGRYTRSRLYSVAGRLYYVYAIATEDKLASPEVERYLTSFKVSVGVSEFVPQDKVRYMKVVRTWKSPGIDNSRTDEVWLGNGKEHLLLRTNTLHVGGSKHVREHGVMFTRVTDAAVYVYYKFGEDAYRYYKYPYDPRFIEPYVPQDINSLLLSLGHNAQVIGDDTLNGRAVTMIDSGSLPNPSIRPPNPNDPESSVTSVRLWVDKESSLVLKREDSTFYFRGPRSETTEIETLQIMENELRDRSTVTVDFFEYTPGGTIIDSPTSPFDATPTPGR